MKFCMLTTFFGPHSFGGDAAFVDRLSRTLARHGHEVHVIYCRDAFDVSRGDQTPRPYDPPPGVVIHPLQSPHGALSPLATHQTGFPLFKAGAIRRLVGAIGCEREERLKVRHIGHVIGMMVRPQVRGQGIGALLLEASGYAVKVFEFVSTEHTRKNTMIAAPRRASSNDGERRKALAEYRELKEFYGVREQRWERLLCESRSLAALFKE